MQGLIVKKVWKITWQVCWSKSSSFNDLFILFPFMYKCISICKRVYMNSRAHGGKMHKVPWTWIHIWLWAAWQTLWEQISDCWKRSKYSQLLSHPSNSLELKLRVNKALLKNFICFIMVFFWSIYMLDASPWHVLT